MGPLLLALVLVRLQSTPEETLQKVVQAFNARDFKAIASLTSGGRTSFNYSALVVQVGREWPTYKLGAIHAEIQGDLAKTTLQLSTAKDGRRETFNDQVDLVKTDSKWLLVPANPLSDKGPRILSTIAYMTVNPAAITQASDAAHATHCLSNVKQLTLACLMFSQDNGDVLKIDPSAARKALSPYVKSAAFWNCPTIGAVGYAFNANLAGKPYSALSLPAGTVLIYEGSKGKLAFRHNGRASVGFADGHVKLVSADDAKQLRWVP